MNPTPPTPPVPALTPETILRRPRTVSFTRFDQEGLLVVPKQNWQLVLNGVGADAFELINGQRTLDEISRELSRAYPGVAPATIVEDVLELMTDLLERGAVELSPPA